jgi:hypothetical protein
MRGDFNMAFLASFQNESLNVTACCQREGVSPACIDACAVYLDIDSVIDKPECLPEFNKLMKCAAGWFFGYDKKDAAPF